MDALGDLRFDNPVCLATPPGETNCLFVVERAGRIYAITNLAQPEKTLFLDVSLSTLFDPAGMEEGMLGMVFHPEFRVNHQFFTFRCTYVPTPSENPGFFDRLSRFTTSKDNPFQVDAASEEIVMDQKDYAIFSHNAGDLHFGPDGFLYLSMGDSSPPLEDLIRTRQPIDKQLFGTILRIDVDKRPDSLPPNNHPSITSRYLIPADNPFIGATTYQGYTVNPSEVRTEIFALGLRNPWRFCFDPITGKILCGDVGESSYEEVNLIEKGGNYGWPYREGFGNTDWFSPLPPQVSSTDPVIAYPHGASPVSGNAIIGGLVYTGSAFPRLNGAYIFADNVSSHVWALHRQDFGVTNQFEWFTGEPSIASFGYDPRDDGVLVANFLTGRIRKLVYQDPSQSTFPKLLSQTGLFTDTQTLIPAPGVVPYSINLPFWSDHADKQRWFKLPEGTSTIRFAESNNWTFPTGTIWIKHFEINQTRNDPRTAQRLETRLLVKTATSVYGVTYKWNAAGTEAELLPQASLEESFPVMEQNGLMRTQVWHYPSRPECMRCHTEQAGFALGFTTPQLNRPRSEDPAENQIDFFSRRGYLTQAPAKGTELPLLAAPADWTFSPEFRVRSYFEANCSQCHRPGTGIDTTRWDARFHTEMTNKHLFDRPLIVPNSPDLSGLFLRLQLPIENFQMPPIATSETNSAALDLIADWITTFPQKPWSEIEIGSPLGKGNATVKGLSMGVAGYGTVPGENGESGHSIFRTTGPSAQLIGTLAVHRFSDPSAHGGILLSSGDLNSGNNFFGGITSTNLFTRTGVGNVVAEKTFLPSMDGEPIVVRVVREGNKATLWTKVNQHWALVDSLQFEAPNDVSTIGFAVTAPGGKGENYAVFDDVSYLSASLRFLQGGTNLVFPQLVRLACDFTRENYDLAKVEFYANDLLIQDTSIAPFTLTWAPPRLGQYKVFARLIGADGSSLDTPAITFVEGPPISGAWFESTDKTSFGFWEDSFGKVAYKAPAFEKNTNGITIGVAGALTSVPFGEMNLSALSVPQSKTRSGVVWSDSNIDATIDFADEQLHRVSFYIADLARSSQPQTLVIRDRFSQEILFQGEPDTFNTGKYLTFLVRGSIEAEFQSVTKAVLSGIFVDPSPIPSPIVEWERSPDSLYLSSPSMLTPSFQQGASIQKVDFFVDGALLESQSSPPFNLAVAKLTPRTHTLVAVAHDIYGQTAISPEKHFTIVLPPAAAKFLGIDWLTKGDWKGKYGGEGYIVVGGGTNLPQNIRIEPSGQNISEWPADNNSNALLDPGSDLRLGSQWVGAWGFAVDLGFEDGSNHLLSLYFYDGPISVKAERIQLLDAVTGAVLNEQLVQDMENGHYYSWLVQGAVRLNLTTEIGASVINGLFVDKPVSGPPQVTIGVPANGSEMDLPPLSPAQLQFPDPGAQIQKVGIYLDNVLINEELGTSSSLALSGITAGEHWLSAFAEDKDGIRGMSAPVLIKGRLPSNSAQFAAIDLIHHGDWIGHYGKEAYLLAQGPKSEASFFQVNISPDSTALFDPYPTDPSALQGLTSQRIAAAWYTQGRLNLSFSFRDGYTHALSLYFLDYKSGATTMNIALRDPATGVLLDQRSLSAFQDGEYFTWDLRGNINFELEGLPYPTVSGIFADQQMTFPRWINLFFSADELNREPENGAALADPDGDGISNISEYVLGTNPRSPNRIWSSFQEGIQGDLLFLIRLNRSAVDVEPSIAFSRDLTTWGPANDFGVSSHTEDTPGFNLMFFTLPRNSASSQLFLRLKVKPTAPAIP